MFWLLNFEGKRNNQSAVLLFVVRTTTSDTLLALFVDWRLLLFPVLWDAGCMFVSLCTHRPLSLDPFLCVCTAAVRVPDRGDPVHRRQQVEGRPVGHEVRSFAFGCVIHSRNALLRVPSIGCLCSVPAGD